MTVSFFYSIITREILPIQSDIMDVTLTAGARTTTLAHFSNLDAVNAWTRLSVAIPANLAGQAVSLRFHGTTNALAITSFYIDTVSLQVVACP
jgi:hypothetical protein